MAFRDEERRRAIAEAAKEPLNKNGMRRDQSPASSRNKVEAALTLNSPDPEPVQRDHTTVAGTTQVQYGGSARDRIERAAAKKRDVNLTPRQSREQTADAEAWMKWNEAYRAKYGCYPPHGV